jgi:hypothetical protein
MEDYHLKPDVVAYPHGIGRTVKMAFIGELSGLSLNLFPHECPSKPQDLYLTGKTIY